MLNPKFRSSVLIASALCACSLAPERTQDAALREDASQPAEAQLDAGAEPAHDAPEARQDEAAPVRDAASGRDAVSAPPVADAAAPATATPDPGSMALEAEAGAAPDSAIPARDASVFRPDASLRDASARRTIMPDIPEAENMFFTADGRLFVSGGENVFEIKRDAKGAWSKTDLFDEECLVEGITHANGHIYGVCSLTSLDGFGQAYLLGGALTAEPRMKIIGRLDDLGIPNGMDADRQGNLYTSYSVNGTIAKLVMAEPLKLARVEVWSKEDLPFVNGLRFIGDYVYFTSMQLEALGTRLGRIRIQPDGSAGPAEYLYARALTLFDDVGVFEGGLMVTDYIAGTIFFFRDGKVVAETPESTFYAPTSVLQGRPPLFRENQLLVTEKGLIGITGETDGDRLSVFDL